MDFSEDILLKYPNCIDCSIAATEVIFSGDYVPQNTIAPVCMNCSQKRFDYFEEHGVPKTIGNEIELCILCGNETGYMLNTNINLRKNYVEGAGQLCEKCA